MKKCTKCGEIKNALFFYKNKQCKSGISGVCKSCQDEASRAWRDKNQTKVSERMRLYSQKWCSKNKDLIGENNKKQIETISNAYAARSMGMKLNECDPKLISAKREQLQIYRLSKEFKLAVKGISK